MPYFFDPMLMLVTLPAVLLAMWAQVRVKSTFAAASQVPANLSGAAAARYVLDSAGLQNVMIEQVPGQLSDHYDPRTKVLRLSSDVYNRRSMAAVGIAAHEAGHAIQDATRYAPLVVRNAAVPLANVGTGSAGLLFMIGLSFPPLLILAILLFAAGVFFQLVNLPVEFDASRRAKKQLVELGVVAPNDMGPVNKVLNAAAWTYVAATLQVVLTLLYLVMRFVGSQSSDD
ncbi:MAG: zinc metallopeptidase [Planctomycetales bacterium]|nr:zinc metallopeptidase [Planctomycetales bacterium]